MHVVDPGHCAIKMDGESAPIGEAGCRSVRVNGVRSRERPRCWPGPVTWRERNLPPCMMPEPWHADKVGGSWRSPSAFEQVFEVVIDGTNPFRGSFFSGVLTGHALSVSLSARVNLASDPIFTPWSAPLSEPIGQSHGLKGLAATRSGVPPGHCHGCRRFWCRIRGSGGTRPPHRRRFDTS